MSRSNKVLETIESGVEASGRSSYISRAVENAMNLFGEEAPTAVAYCGLEAWFEGQEDEVRTWAQVLNRLAT